MFAQRMVGKVVTNYQKLLASTMILRKERLKEKAGSMAWHSFLSQTIISWKNNTENTIHLVDTTDLKSKYKEYEINKIKERPYLLLFMALLFL